MNKKIVGITVGTTINPERIGGTSLNELRQSIEANTSAIEKLLLRVARLENGTASDTSAILDTGKLDSMILE